MFNRRGYEPIDYLIIGHISQDLTPDGPQLGGTASFSGLTAKALGLRVGIVTAWGGEITLDPLKEIQFAGFQSEHSTTFENIYVNSMRKQTIRHVADHLDLHLVPETWRRAPIVHLAPLAQEISPAIVHYFPNSLIGLTPQGWLREWDENGQIHSTEWPEASFVLPNTTAAVISIEDIEGDQEIIRELASACPILVVTLGAGGAGLYWNGEVQHFEADRVTEINPTGAGDIFAAAFFYRLYSGAQPPEAVHFANRMASISVTRKGLASIPTRDEIYDLMTEVF
jgi:sugar/nucleoside kinase (ribokinase family)